MRSLCISVVLLVLGIALTAQSGALANELMFGSARTPIAGAKVWPRHLPRDGAVPVGLQLRGYIPNTLKERGQTIPPSSLAFEFDKSGRISALPSRICGQNVLAQSPSVSRVLTLCGQAILGRGKVNFGEVGGEFRADAQLVLLYNGTAGSNIRMLLYGDFEDTSRHSFVLPVVASVASRKGYGFRVVINFTPLYGSEYLQTTAHYSIHIDRFLKDDGGRRSFISVSCSHAVLRGSAQVTLQEGSTLQDSFSDAACV